MFFTIRNILSLPRVWSRNSTHRHVTQLLRKVDNIYLRDHIAIKDINGTSLTYGALSQQSKQLADVLRSHIRPDVHSIGCFISSHQHYVTSMLATWRLRKTFVPLSLTHTAAELQYFAADSGIGLILHSSEALQITTKTEKINDIMANINSTGLPIIDLSSSHPVSTPSNSTDSNNDGNQLYNDDDDDDDVGALVLYTSGTTGQPKGVLHTRQGVQALVSSLSAAWEYKPTDCILHFLPLYHLHGLLNKLLCVLYNGGTIVFVSSAAADRLWHTLAEHKHSHPPLTLFMAVPTIYARMIELVKQQGVPAQTLLDAQHTLSNCRFHACGSAALPDTIMDDWHTLTGHTLLERYGMTELGMVLSNPLHGPRLKGCVGQSLPGVRVRVVDDEEQVVVESDGQGVIVERMKGGSSSSSSSSGADGSGGDSDGTPGVGELRVKSAGVFSQYLHRPEATAESFDKDGWFKTGDIAVWEPASAPGLELELGLELVDQKQGLALAQGQQGSFRLLGRSSVDIIKSSGYKLSALEIEREILAHPQVLEAAVLAKKDDILGEKVIAVIVLRDQSHPYPQSNPDTAATTTNNDATRPSVSSSSNHSHSHSHSHRPTFPTASTTLSESHLDPTNNVFLATKHLRAFLSTRLAHYKQPQEVFIVDALPRNHLGKVNKKSLMCDMQLG